MNVNVKGEQVWVLCDEDGLVLGVFQDVDDAKTAGRSGDDEWVWVEPQATWRHKTGTLRIMRETVQ